MSPEEFALALKELRQQTGAPHPAILQFIRAAARLQAQADDAEMRERGQPEEKSAIDLRDGAQRSQGSPDA